jgi:hypothetical protein
MYRVAAILIAVLLLSACGGAPVSPTRATSIQPLASSQHPRDTPARTAVLAPTAASIPVPTTVPPLITSAPASDSAAVSLPEPTLKGYTVLVLLRSVTVALEDLAAQTEGGSPSDEQGIAAAGQRIAVAALLKTIDDNLAQETPDPALEDAWKVGRAQAPEIKDVLSQWAAQQLTPQDVTARLAPIRPELDQMLTTARQELVRAYGIDTNALSSLTTDALANIRAALQSATSE